MMRVARIANTVLILRDDEAVRWDRRMLEAIGTEHLAWFQGNFTVQRQFAFEGVVVVLPGMHLSPSRELEPGETLYQRKLALREV